ncbi:MAG TPA: DevR family CRISPR-associated autoregulator [Ktedonobacterales bacterium]|nr:DevR family CRISPR-associated autoregulator [Ktedonobacterales bacterium]
MALQIASFSIAARATLDMHSLNNEGGEGNQIQTRMVDIVGADGRMHNVNAISGDMLKHIQAQHFFELARSSGLPLCAGCSHFDANRINADKEWNAQMPASDREALSSLLARCAMDDTAGILITAGGRSLPRKSVVEFGWVVGIPQIVQSESYFHVKYASEREKSRVDADNIAREAVGSNLGQAIFHRPASSGVYAIVCHIELGRIGYNDISQSYAIDEEQRARRAKALIQSVMHTFLELNGAMRTTQLPHLVALDGMLTWSSASALPAPMVSPLAGGSDDGDAYREQIAQIAQALNGAQQPAAVQARRFDDVGAFARELRTLVDQAVPASLVMAR